MSEASADSSFRTDEADAPRAFRGIASERITVINAVQSTVGAYLSPAPIEDVATAVLIALRGDP